MVTFEHKFFQYQDIKLEYVEYLNKNSNQNILLVHGFSSDYTHFEKFIDEFANFNIFSISMPAHGNSEGKQELMTEIVCMDILIKFIETLNLNNLIIIGHSMGGGITMMALPNIVNRVSKIILIGPQNRTSLSRVEAFKETFFPRNVEEYKKLVKLLYFEPNKIINNVNLMNTLDHYFKNNKEKLDLVYQLGDNLPDLKNFDLMDKGNELWKNKPILLVYGEADGIIDLAKIEAYFEERFTKLQILKVSKAGHSPWIENYQEFISPFKKFINE
ncbi:alpha/beta fold hydrolase [Mycoplasmopsis columbinasalis]|uniref:Esterase/lipase n=1 Tax=Mycoplasmopsis columbinasalis TaxID=114880 RepID=A0A449BA86_9BACT|nr:alpha/beta hydrolase [Mycoplasmopsis columbinasalis]VEU78113.1 esterase/lipase [Mycoplasmopsis columbinasalis]